LLAEKRGEGIINNNNQVIQVNRIPNENNINNNNANQNNNDRENVIEMIVNNVMNDGKVLKKYDTLDISKDVKLNEEVKKSRSIYQKNSNKGYSWRETL